MGKGRNSNSKKKKNQRWIHILCQYSWSSTFSWALGCCGNRELGNCLVGKYCMCLFCSQIPPPQQLWAHACQWWGLKCTESRITVQRSSVRQTGWGRCTYINGPLWAIFCFSVHKMLCNLQINVQALRSGMYKWLLVKSLRIKAIFSLPFELCSLLFKFERFHTSCDDDMSANTPCPFWKDPDLEKSSPQLWLFSEAWEEKNERDAHSYKTLKICWALS